MVDNFSLIRSLLTFDGEDDFYYTQLIQRKKENPTNRGDWAVKTWTINSFEKFDELKPDIIALAIQFNARATIRLNKRSRRQCALETLSELASNIAKGDYTPPDKVHSSIMGKFHADPVKKWLLDADDIAPDAPIVSEILAFIRDIQPVGDKLVSVIPSKSGCHIMTTPFNPVPFTKAYPLIGIQKDSPTNLYIV